MKREFLLATACLVVAGSPAFSDDSTSQAPKPVKQRMQECVAKQMQKDGSMSANDARMHCKVKVKKETDPTGTDKAAAGSPDSP